MHKHLLTFILLVCIVPWALAICEPDCTGKKPGDKVEDPKDCKKYYLCMAGEIPTETSLYCGEANHFDPIIGQCVSGSKCEPSCVLPACHLTCTDNIDLISDPFDCSVFKVCLAGGVVGDSFTCPSDKPNFDGQYCVSDKDKCCSDLCSPYCYPGVIQAPDPTNCTAYYICEHEGIPEQDHHFSCKGHTVFDVSLGRCVEGAQCRPLCDNGEIGNATPHSTKTSTTTTSKPGGGCKDSFTCPHGGFFPQCSTCEPGYFECKGTGQQGILKMCQNGFVFNTNPSFAYCVSPSNCPFYP